MGFRVLTVSDPWKPIETGYTDELDVMSVAYCFHFSKSEENQSLAKPLIP